MRTKIKSYATLLIGWPLSALALIFLINRIIPEWGKISNSIHSISYPLLLYSVLSFLAYYFIRSYTWSLLLKAKGHNVSLSDSTFLWGISEVKRYIPGSIWSFLGRTMSFSEKGVPKKDTGHLLVIEAGLVFLTAIFVALLSIPFVFKYFFASSNLPNYLIVLSVIFLIFASVAYVYQEKILKYLPKKFERVGNVVLNNFPPILNFRLLVISSLAFFFFGLGYYFVISSIIFLPAELVFQLVGFYVFSLLVGLISFITPTGLGVREGAIVIGLANFMEKGIAGFAALFGRFILILSELMFIALSYFWMKSKSAFLEKEETWVSEHKHESLLLIFITIFSLYFTTINFLRYDEFYTGRFDLGNMSQTVWNTTQGRFFELTDPNGTETVSRLAFHADYILVILAPFYFLWSNPKMLLLIQTLIVAFAACFVYLISIKVIRNKNVALIFSLAYLLNPSVQRITIYDFHAVALATTFLLGAFYFMLIKKYKSLLLFLFLAAITKEQVWIVTAFLGIYLTLKHKQTKLGISIAATSLIFFYLFIWRLIPNAHGSSHFALSYFNDGGGSPSSLLKHYLLSPISVIHTVFSNDRLDYLTQLFLPLGFLSFAAPTYLVFLLPDLALNLLSDKPELHQIYYQYTAILTPFLFIAAIYGFCTIQKFHSKFKNTHISIFILICSFLSLYLYSPLPGSLNPNLDMISKPNSNRQILDYEISNVAENKSVSATNNIASHFSNRERIYVFPNGIETADYIFFQKRDLFNMEDYDKFMSMLVDISLSDSYTTIYNDSKLIILSKTTSD